MADIEAKVNMSLDEIIKLDKKKKTSNPKTNRGGGRPARGGGRPIRGAGRSARGGGRGNMRGRGRTSRSQTRRGGGVGNMPRARSASRGRQQQQQQQFNNRRGNQYKRFPQNNNTRGGFNKKFANGNLTRSRSNVSLNRGANQNRNGFAPRRGRGRFGMARSRSRTNLQARPTFMAKRGGFLKRTNSMPNLSDPSSVYNRLGYQSPAQIAYRNRVKRAKSVLLQRQNKAMRMANALGMISPARNMKNLSPLKQQNVRRNSMSNMRSEQLLRAQKRAQYEQKLMRMGAARSNVPTSMSYMSSYDDIYGQQHPAMNLYRSQTPSPSSMGYSQRRGRSPFRRSLSSIKQPKGRSMSLSRQQQQQQQQRRRSRSRSRPRPSVNVRRNGNSIINMMDGGDYGDRTFSEVMYSLSNNFGVTGRTLNDRFSLF